jgi:hypothetical protein
VRAFRSVGGNPIVFDRVKGPYCWDVDGNKYIDYIGSWGPAIVGAANDEVRVGRAALLPPPPSLLRVLCRALCWRCSCCCCHGGSAGRLAPVRRSSVRRTSLLRVYSM